MQEQNGFTVCSDLRLRLAQDTHAARLEGIARETDVGNFVTEVVDAALGVARQKLGNRRSLTERLYQLDLCIRQSDEHRAYAVLGLRERLRHLRAQNVTV